MNDSLVQADIFFFITSIAVVVLSILGAILLFYLIRALRKVDEVVSIVKREVETVRDDITQFRASVHAHKKIAGHLLDFMKEKVTTTKRTMKKHGKKT